MKKRGEFRSRTALKSHVNPMEATISLATKVIQSFANNGTVTLSPASDLTSCMLPESKNKYYHDINTIGMSSESTIGSGLNYVRALQISYHCIEATRLGNKVSQLSRRVLGPDHKLTIQADKLLSISCFYRIAKYFRLFTIRK